MSEKIIQFSSFKKRGLVIDDYIFTHGTKDGYYYNSKNINFIDNSGFLKDWTTFDRFRDGNVGVYMIHDFYIGKSTEIKARLLKHFLIAINQNNPNYKTKGNSKLAERINYKLNNGEVFNIKILSTNTRDENFLIEEYRSKGYPLANCEIVKRGDNRGTI